METINTLDAKGEVLITIMASLAQQESQSMSQNIKLGLQYRYQQGRVQVNHNWFLGYTKDENGQLVIDPEQAEVVRRIYAVIRRTEYVVYERFPQIKPSLPEEIHFISAEKLLELYPNLTPHEREDKIAKEFGAVFIEGIGGPLKNGEPHDGRAPDYDDWTTPNSKGGVGLNGDIIVWNNVLGRSFELSSMCIRVDKEALLRQLKVRNLEERKELYFHKRLLNDELPLSIGGGIGQSRLCMFFLRKAHIGEIQSSIWPDEQRKRCADNNIPLI